MYQLPAMSHVQFTKRTSATAQLRPGRKARARLALTANVIVGIFITVSHAKGAEATMTNGACHRVAAFEIDELGFTPWKTRVRILTGVAKAIIPPQPV